MSRLTASSASSFGVQCVTGLPEFSGFSQLIATIWTICSAVNFGGAPRPGASLNISSIACLSSLSLPSSSIAFNLSLLAPHRPRHLCTFSLLLPTSLAMCTFRFPSAAFKMISARLTNRWLFVVLLTICSSIAFWRSVTSIGAGFGPRGFPSFFFFKFCVFQPLLVLPEKPHHKLLVHFCQAVLVTWLRMAWLLIPILSQ